MCGSDLQKPPKVLITSALPYINGIKHLGNLVGSMLPADLYARFSRAQGREVLYVCATDEHGTPAELAAEAAGQSVEKFCAEQHEIQKSLGARFGISWDIFGRSSSLQNRQLTQEFARALWRNGYLELRKTQQVFSLSDNRFLPDRYVIGKCPHCNFEAARGDQCENCTRVLDPADLIAPRSTLSGSTALEMRDSVHLFLKQSSLSSRLREWMNTKTTWPSLVTSIAKKWLDEGLQDRGITRDLSWGVPVPDDIAGGALKDKVFYVWFDAPIEYIGATQEWAASRGVPDEWVNWWYGENVAHQVKYVQFMGKDNIPFHVVGFPATLIASGAPWKLVDTIKGFNWLNYYGGKFSTSQKRGIFMDQALELLSADYWRYYLMANAPENADTTFTWDHFASTVNKDLADVLGNFVNRVAKFTISKFPDGVPNAGPLGAEEQKLAEDLDAKVIQYTDLLERIEIRKAMMVLRSIWVLGNEYLTRSAPWRQIKVDVSAAATSIRTALTLISLFAVLSEPVIPFASCYMRRLVKTSVDLKWPNLSVIDLLKAELDYDYSVPIVLLFSKIEAEQISEWERTFGGFSNIDSTPSMHLSK